MIEKDKNQMNRRKDTKMTLEVEENKNNRNNWLLFNLITYTSKRQKMISNPKFKQTETKKSQDQASFKKDQSAGKEHSEDEGRLANGANTELDRRNKF